MSAVLTTQGMLGFDCNSRLSATAAKLFQSHGYEFVLRYVPRLVQHANDLTADELGLIRAVGLGVMLVQHVESDLSWRPTAEKGTAYGETAAARCVALGIAPRSTVWLDLEAVGEGVPASDIIAYCNNWYRAVHAMGYEPGVYVGWRSGLTPDQLYWRLKARHFWGAYNLNADERPSIRGVQMRQREVRAGDVPLGVGIAIDVDVVTGDALGGFPVMDR